MPNSSSVISLLYSIPRASKNSLSAGTFLGTQKYALSLLISQHKHFWHRASIPFLEPTSKFGPNCCVQKPNEPKFTLVAIKLIKPTLHQQLVAAQKIATFEQTICRPCSCFNHVTFSFSIHSSPLSHQRFIEWATNLESPTFVWARLKPFVLSWIAPVLSFF